MALYQEVTIAVRGTYVQNYKVNVSTSLTTDEAQEEGLRQYYDEENPLQPKDELLYWKANEGEPEVTVELREEQDVVDLPLFEFNIDLGMGKDVKGI